MPTPLRPFLFALLAALPATAMAQKAPPKENPTAGV